MVDRDANRVVVSNGETFDGDLLPAERAEISRPVTVKPDGTVQGSVYGEDVTVAADATITGSVMARNRVQLDGGHVHGDVGTPGAVTGSDARVLSGVTGSKVTLTDALVVGNVVGTDVILEDCLVTGIVAAERDLHLLNTDCYTFKSLGTTTLDGARVVLPQAVVDGELTAETPTTVLGLGELDVDADTDTDTDTDEAETRPQLTAADRLERDGTTYLSLAPRILNLDRVSDRLDALEAGLQEVVATDFTDETNPLTTYLDVLGIEDPPGAAT